jgi:hypothetical protein
VLLEKHFKIGIDYKNLLLLQQKQDSDNKKHGGHNKETIMLTIKIFNLFCIKSVSSVLTPHQIKSICRLIFYKFILLLTK